MSPRRALRVWVTRAQPGADATAERLRALGHAPLIASLLEVRALAAPAGPPSDVAAVAFTSANAVRAYADWSTERALPAFAVGEATAEAARRAGFRAVRSADGDVAALAALIIGEPPGGALLYPRARDTAGDLAGLLCAAGVPVRPIRLYETVAVEALPRMAARALRSGDLDLVLLHSPRASQTLMGLLAAEPEKELARLRAAGLSGACVAPLAGLPFQDVLTAATPNEAALLALLA